MTKGVGISRILFVGDMWYGSNARSLRDGFLQLGHDVVTVDTSLLTKPTKLSPPWIYKTLNNQERLPSISKKIEQQIRQAASSHLPDILVVFKGIFISQAFLIGLPIRIKIHYSPDDVSNPENLSEDYLVNEMHWDAIVTTKSFNVPELIARGASKVIHVWSAYDPALHFKWSEPKAKSFKIGFVGNRRVDRRELILRIAQEYRHDFYLAGPGWWKDSVPLAFSNSVVPRFGKYGERFSESVSKVQVNLVLLNSGNRDLHTCRTFEVPAAGGLVLAKRTHEHEELFKDMQSAVFFGSTEELIEKTQFLISNPSHAQQIRERGYKEITNGGHTYKDRAAEIMRELSC